MKKVLMVVLPLCLAIVISFGGTSLARPKYEEVFKKEYYKPDSKDAKEKALAGAIDKISETKAGKTTSCNVCHVAGAPSKKDRNAYGKELSTLLGKNEKDDDKIKKGLKDAEGKKADDKGPTYGELLKDGKLPAEPKK
jgi:cytochrome c5